VPGGKRRAPSNSLSRCGLCLLQSHRSIVYEVVWVARLSCDRGSLIKIPSTSLQEPLRRSAAWAFFDKLATLGDNGPRSRVGVRLAGCLAIFIVSQSFPKQNHLRLICSLLPYVVNIFFRLILSLILPQMSYLTKYDSIKAHPPTAAEGASSTIIQDPLQPRLSPAPPKSNRLVDVYF